MKIEIEIDDAVAASVNGFLERQDPELDLAGMVQMLLEDVALAVRRPESWEGVMMRDLLASHGYEP